VLSFGYDSPENKYGGGDGEVKEAVCLSMLVSAHLVVFLATLSARFHPWPCAGNPTMNLRSFNWHIPQLAQVTFSFRVAGQLSTGVPLANRWNVGASAGSTVTSGRPCFSNSSAWLILFADRFTVKP
tara:strand:+ start:326 stop:706 length:381 start_codon:yes stop_codon:yes gene_type:complete